MLRYHLDLLAQLLGLIVDFEVQSLLVARLNGVLSSRLSLLLRTERLHLLHVLVDRAIRDGPDVLHVDLLTNHGILIIHGRQQFVLACAALAGDALATCRLILRQVILQKYFDFLLVTNDGVQIPLLPLAHLVIPAAGCRAS